MTNYDWSPVARKPKEHVDHYIKLLNKQEDISENVMARAKEACTTVGGCTTTLHTNTFRVKLDTGIFHEVNKTSWTCTCGEENCWHVVAIKLHILGPILTRRKLFGDHGIEPSDEEPVF